MNRSINPPDIAPPAAHYAHAILVEQPLKTLYTSGVVPTAPDGTVPDGLADQTRQVWANIAAMLREAGMEPRHVVSVTTYVMAGEPLGPVMAARDEFLGRHKAASTLVTVPALAQPAWRVEVAVVAAM